MGKRVDKDPTMELSTSQLVPDAPPRGDASRWNQAVVGTEQFAPPRAPAADRRPVLIFIAFVVFAAAAGVAVYLFV